MVKKFKQGSDPRARARRNEAQATISYECPSRVAAQGATPMWARPFWAEGHTWEGRLDWANGVLGVKPGEVES